MPSALQNQGFKRKETFAANPHNLCIPGVDFECDESHPLYDPGRAAVMRDDELVASIDAHGVLESVVVRLARDRIEVVAGARRVFNARIVQDARASRGAKPLEVPITVKQLTDKEAIVLKSTENSLRKNDQPIDKARRARRMVELFGCTKDEVARACGVSEGYVRQWFKVLDTPELVSALDERRLTFKGAVALSSVPKTDLKAAIVAATSTVVPVTGGETAASVPVTTRAAKAAAKSAKTGEKVAAAPSVREIRRMVATEESLERRSVSDAVLDMLRWIAGELPESRIKGLTELRRKATPR